MTPTQKNNILSLIAATIFADRHTYPSEIEVFISATAKLKMFKGMKPKMSEARLNKWYDANSEAVRAHILTPFYKDWLYALLDQLSDISGKTELVEVMRKISVADGKVHINERSLIMLTQRHWGLL